jgi:hypothetical protein
MQRADSTVDELRAAAESKEFTVACSTVVGLWGTARVVYLNVDRVPFSFYGTVTVDPSSCAILMTNVGGSAAPSLPPVTKPPAK